MKPPYGDAHEPGPEVRRIPQGLEPSGCIAKGLLKNVFQVRIIACKAIDHPRHVSSVPPVEHPERPIVTGPSLGDEYGVAGRDGGEGRPWGLSGQL